MRNEELVEVHWEVYPIITFCSPNNVSLYDSEWSSIVSVCPQISVADRWCHMHMYTCTPHIVSLMITTSQYCLGSSSNWLQLVLWSGYSWGKSITKTRSFSLCPTQQGCGLLSRIQCHCSINSSSNGQKWGRCTEGTSIINC